MSVSFSADSKFIATLTGGPDWAVHYWAWEKSKVLAMVRVMGSAALAAPAPPGATKDGKEAVPLFQATQVCINPTDSTNLTVIGFGLFKIFRYQEGVLKTVGSAKFESKVRSKLMIEFPCACLDCG